MKLVFRVDASIHIGTGHVMRCLSLAHAMKNKGGECYFLCKEHQGNLIHYIQDRGYSVCRLPLSNETVSDTAQIDYRTHANWLASSQEEDAALCLPLLHDLAPHWLIVDHYALDATWEGLVRPSCQNLMVIDDLADRPHLGDVLLDQTFGRSQEDYRALVPVDCVRLCGSEYALLRPEFVQWREYSLARRKHGGFENLLISMGGIDKTNTTGQVLRALEGINLPTRLEITVVMGASAPWQEDVRQLCSQMSRSTRFLINADNMAELMANSDLSVGAVGTTTWERMCLGLPTIALSVAQNQVEACVFLAEKGLINYLGQSDRLADDAIRSAVSSLISRPDVLMVQSSKAARLIDGLGAERLCATIFTWG